MVLSVWWARARVAVRLLAKSRDKHILLKYDNASAVMISVMASVAISGIRGKRPNHLSLAL